MGIEKRQRTPEPEDEEDTGNPEGMPSPRKKLTRERSKPQDCNIRSSYTPVDLEREESMQELKTLEARLTKSQISDSTTEGDHTSHLETDRGNPDTHDVSRLHMWINRTVPPVPVIFNLNDMQPLTVWMQNIIRLTTELLSYERNSREFRFQRLGKPGFELSCENPVVQRHYHTHYTGLVAILQPWCKDIPEFQIIRCVQAPAIVGWLQTAGDPVDRFIQMEEATKRLDANLERILYEDFPIYFQHLIALFEIDWARDFGFYQDLSVSVSRLHGCLERVAEFLEEVGSLMWLQHTNYAKDTIFKPSPSPSNISLSEDDTYGGTLLDFKTGIALEGPTGPNRLPTPPHTDESSRNTTPMDPNDNKKMEATVKNLLSAIQIPEGLLSLEKPSGSVDIETQGLQTPPPQNGDQKGN